MIRLEEEAIFSDGLTVKVDSQNTESWSTLTKGFTDANLLQTLAYGVSRAGRAGVSHLVVRNGDRVVGAVQVRLSGLPSLGQGLAYVRWGPIGNRGMRLEVS